MTHDQKKIDIQTLSKIINFTKVLNNILNKKTKFLFKLISKYVTIFNFVLFLLYIHYWHFVTCCKPRILTLIKKSRFRLLAPNNLSISLQPNH